MKKYHALDKGELFMKTQKNCTIAVVLAVITLALSLVFTACGDGNGGGGNNSNNDNNNNSGPVFLGNTLMFSGEQVYLEDWDDESISGIYTKLTGNHTIYDYYDALAESGSIINGKLEYFIGIPEPDILENLENTDTSTQSLTLSNPDSCIWTLRYWQ